ncbi:creatininase family protein [Paenactinomyces guangxiensis]|uniref:Creatininase family protein n=1 Tax=Paenactinomyces guangxiensis TaxID=1490290 RepID=A0A7W1WPA7_9BACL|nr:creatininase family protein [Paenactinomyces guangxiensis]MBA4493540.1 creatininase family protein [Paenactinomyces guangxiensis]MBH8590631.1 creatininase family protein [Paenactinomyces guangxiensis]
MDYSLENSFEVQEKIREKKVAILPIGAVEAHGPHLPLGTDNILAERLADKIASEVDAFVLPLLPYGQVWSLKNFPGSLTISNQTLIQLVTDLGKSLYEQGFKVFVLLSAHLGNITALKEAARHLYESTPGLTVLSFFYPGTTEVMNQVREGEKVHHTYIHACEIETSIMLYLAEEFVDMSKAIKDLPDIPPDADVTPTPWERFTRTAVLGDATLATREKGEKIVTLAIKNSVRLIEHAKKRDRTTQ